MRKFKKGDIVKVWSLQSFSGGGFLNGEHAFVRQSQKGDSVILCVVRKSNDGYALDKAYEVYAKQCELVTESNNKTNSYDKARQELEKYYVEIINNNSIS